MEAEAEAAWHGRPLASPATASYARQGLKPKHHLAAGRGRQLAEWLGWAGIAGLILHVGGLSIHLGLETPPAHHNLREILCEF
jgi:hypothetical protein